MEDDADKRQKGIKCLQQFRDELHSQECRDQVGGQDMRLCDCMLAALLAIHRAAGVRHMRLRLCVGGTRGRPQCCVCHMLVGTSVHAPLAINRAVSHVLLGCASVFREDLA